MISSALDHRDGHELSIHLLHDGTLEESAQEALMQMVRARGGELSLLEIPPDWVEGLRGWDYITPTMWFRIFLPELLPAVERVLYLDVDTIVLDRLDELFTTELGDDLLAAVPNVFQLDHLGRLEQLGIDDPRDYFNSGVLLMNLEEMRRDQTSRKLKDFAVASGADLLWPDQDTLNLVLAGRWRRLHPRWNAMTSMFSWPHSVYAYGTRATAEARLRPAIRHFEGPSINKPWHLLCETPFRDRYFEHRRGTPWPKVHLEGRTPANLARHAARPWVRRLRSWGAR
jgi:lipopolysaccharide biosynthesis glycosyltransferase